MSTRAVVTVKDDRDTFHIYTHSDGYPEYQVKRLHDALPFAWQGDRFEAMDFAAAFVAGSKTKGGGNVYLTQTYENHGDLEFRYEVSHKAGKHFIAIFEVDGDTSKPLWAGTLAQMKQKYGAKFYKAA